MSIIPVSKPQEKRRDTIARIPSDVLEKYHVILVGVRGYYRDSMGVVGKNDRSIYDDAIFVLVNNTLPIGAAGDIIDSGEFLSFNANTDPSYSDKQKPDVAVLSPGIHLYKKGRHRVSNPPSYPAFRPANKEEELPVTRSGKPSMGIAINIHKGGINGTSSLGCQTIPPDQWDSFRSTVYMLMDRYEQSVIPYVLTANA